jgi:tetratricopeptide (TPR) repeat protein
MLTISRRFSLAFLALTLATLILHDRCAALLVIRGDGELAAGHTAAAHAFYERALWFRPRSEEAAERLVFSDLEDGGLVRLREAMQVSAEALAIEPANAGLWTDRALCASRLGDDHDAEIAFDRAGHLTHDGRLLYLSALAAHRLGENVDIRIYESHHAGAGKRA